MSEKGKGAAVTLNKQDLRRSWFKWMASSEQSNSYERLQALLFCGSISNCLEKLYPNKEDLSAALQRHLQFYNSEADFGCLIPGIVLSMEEERANGADIPDEAITGLKTGLMGPLAGIGDTIVWGTLKPIIYGIGITFAVQGFALGAFIPLLFAVVSCSIAYWCWMTGYKTGRTSIHSILRSGRINELITAASIMGLFMMGALGSSYVSLTIPLEIALENMAPIQIQSILDSILPGLLPLGCIMGIYWYFKKKGQNYNMVIATILAVSLLGSLIGIF